MSTQRYDPVRGSAIRVTGLSPRGFYDSAAVQFGVSKSITSVQVSEISDGGSNETLRSAEDEPRLRFIEPTQTIRYEVDINFTRCDPAILSLVSGVPVVTNANGDVVGFDVDTRIKAAAFALEMWSSLSSSTPPPAGLGFGEGPFGSIPFGGGSRASRKRYGYMLFPFLRGGIVSGFAFDNGLVSFNLRKARTVRMSPWAYGPYDLEGVQQRLLKRVSRNTHWRAFVTPSAPPVAQPGVSTVADVIYGGTPDSTTPDILFGGTAASAGPWAISGGAP